jgi:fructose-specific PTS system IIA-like component
MLAEATRAFTSRVALVKVGGERADVRSVLSLVGLDVKFGDECVIAIEGEDAGACRVALAELIEQRLAEEDESAAKAVEASVTAVRLPVSLERLPSEVLSGVGVSPGVGQGISVLVSGLTLTPEQAFAKAGSPVDELAKVRVATVSLRDELSRRALGTSGIERELLTAHASIATDPALLTEVERAIEGGVTAVQAVAAAAGQFCGRLGQASSAYIRDRVVDVQDVAMQLLTRLSGKQCAACGVTLTEPSVVCAEVLTPSQLLGLDRALLRGLVLGHMGATSHTVILARSMGVPAVLDAPVSQVAAGRRLMVDGGRGVAFVDPSAKVGHWYERSRIAETRRSERLAPLVRGQATTTDGVGLEVGCNASGAEEVARAMLAGADGVGLLRTELLFLDRDKPPSEQEQFEAYTAVVRAAGGKPVIIRTLDIGGDKPALYMDLPREENPFLGQRGFRLYADHPRIVRDQLRAVLRASALGPVKVMAPMVSTPGEAAAFREMVNTADRELSSEGVAVDQQIQVGVMVEVPGLALVMDQLCRHVDFVSIGTNDLAQYTFAVDRGNSAVAGLHDVRHPAFLRLLRLIVDGARTAGRWVGVCGEMGGDVENIPLMLGLGVHEVSGAPGDAPRLKLAVREADQASCRALVEQACNCADSAEVSALLQTGSWRAASVQPITGEEFVVVGVQAATKEDAIRQGVEHLYVLGRTDRPDDVERAVWTREAEYSTGMGDGFAVPHCRVSAVTSASLVMLKLASPIEWGSSDGQPVQVVLMLTVPSSDTGGTHLKVFAKLARKLMHEDFRASLMNATGPGEAHSAIAAALGL